MLQASETPETFDEEWARPHAASAAHRVFDCACATAGLLLLSPLFGLIAVAVKLADGGSVFYRQDRLGKGFKTFRLCKFRTMVAGADRMGFITTSNDSRVTCVGRLLRRYKLDELPQLFNVVKGDMQLVGARPEVDQYVQMFRPQYSVILQERPGITNPATLAFRHEEKLLSSEHTEQQYVEEILPAKIRLSIEYQRQRTFISDLSTLFRTLVAVFD
jgi:lipopolysaccharide/colanic/teichoic acid biosynthesis glycosyltransferase